MGEVVALGTRLRRRREELGLTQAQAARQLDVARTAYRLWEMEAARPAPDRWRGIANWLGISMTALLLAEELIDEQEAATAQRVALGAGLTAPAWDARSTAREGDYFSQERALIADQAQMGNLSVEEATNLRRILSRIEKAAAGASARRWHAGSFRTRFPNTELAPALARAALATTAVGIPEGIFDDAALAVSELVTNSVKHSGSDWVEVAIAVDSEVLRVEVSDLNNRPVRPRTPDATGGWGLALIAEIADRWGVDRRRAGKTIWIELDLTPAA